MAKRTWEGNNPSNVTGEQQNNTMIQSQGHANSNPCPFEPANEGESVTSSPTRLCCALLVNSCVQILFLTRDVHRPVTRCSRCSCLRTDIAQRCRCLHNFQQLFHDEIPRTLVL